MTAILQRGSSVLAVLILASCGAASTPYAPTGARCEATGQQLPRQQLPRQIRTHLERAERALDEGYAHAAAQQLREAALEIELLREGASSGQRGALENDALILESAAVQADSATLRQRAELEPLLLGPQAHLAWQQLSVWASHCAAWRAAPR